jgi:hypothetical protein
MLQWLEKRAAGFLFLVNAKLHNLKYNEFVSLWNKRARSDQFKLGLNKKRASALGKQPVPKWSVARPAGCIKNIVSYYNYRFSPYRAVNTPHLGYKTSQLISYREIIAYRSQNNTKHTNARSGQIAAFFDGEPGGTYNNHRALKR